MPDKPSENSNEGRQSAEAPSNDSRKDEIADDEVVFRHIPGGILFQNPPDTPITSANFRQREGERGLSVSRSSLTTPEAVLDRLGDPTKGSRIAACRAGDIRALGFELAPDPLDDNKAHALILPGSNDLKARTPRKLLANLFQYLDLPDQNSAIPDEPT